MTGTLSHAGGKPRGPVEKITEADHCRWCGDRLAPEWPNSDGVGYRDNGVFCSLRCGFQWAALQFGVRYREAS
jgi:hypothetical protein